MSTKAKRLSDGSIAFHCPGCDGMHHVKEPGWSFNGDFESPTITPSILVTWEFGDERVKHVCHSFVKDGTIQFLADCTHALAGQNVLLLSLDDARLD